MLRLLLSLDEAKRPNRMAGVAPWAIIVEALAAKGMCFADHLIYFWNNNFLGRHYTAQNCYDKWATLMKKYKKILLKLEKSGTGSVESKLPIHNCLHDNGIHTLSVVIVTSICKRDRLWVNFDMRSINCTNNTSKPSIILANSKILLRKLSSFKRPRPAHICGEQVIVDQINNVASHEASLR